MHGDGLKAFLAATVLAVWLAAPQPSCGQTSALDQSIDLTQKLSAIDSSIGEAVRRKRISSEDAARFRLEKKRIEDEIEQKRVQVYGTLPRELQDRFSERLEKLEFEIISEDTDMTAPTASMVLDIRREIMNHKGLSQKAQSVTLSESRGVLVVGGAVDNFSEKEIIEGIARKAGARKVVSRLLVIE